MSEFATTVRIEGGQIQVRNRSRLDAWAARQKDGEYNMVLERAHATRSLEQNALYWVGYVNPLAAHTGCHRNYMHAYLKVRFLPAAKRKTKTLLLHNQHGEIIDERQIDLSTTTTLNKIEWDEYLKAIEELAIELGVTVGSNREAA